VTEPQSPQAEDKKPAAVAKKKKKGAKTSTTPGDGPSTNLRSRMRAYQESLQPKFKKQRVGVVYDEEMLLHRHHRDEHPERPERVMAIYLNLLKKQ
jgi:hypothetical protein